MEECVYSRKCGGHVSVNEKKAQQKKWWCQNREVTQSWAGKRRIQSFKYCKNKNNSEIDGLLPFTISITFT